MIKKKGKEDYNIALTLCNENLKDNYRRNYKEGGIKMINNKMPN